MAGNVSIPNVIATSSGVVPGARFDDNWNVLRDYINAREITQGTLGARPAAGVPGRFYYASDTGQFFADTGTAWVQIGAPSGLGIWSVRGSRGVNNTATPLTKYDFTADAIQFRHATTGQTAQILNPGTQTLDITVAGPTAGGRDQAGAFTANSYVHVYDIWNGSMHAMLGSTVAPTIGPTLPGGYTSWNYRTALRLNASVNFLSTIQRGSRVTHVGQQVVLPSGASTIATAVDVSAFVPPTALEYEIADGGHAITTDGAGALVADLEIHIVSGTVFGYLARPALGAGNLANASNVRLMHGGMLMLPNVGQQFFYKWTLTAGSAPVANITLMSYRVANGGD